VKASARAAAAAVALASVFGACSRAEQPERLISPGRESGIIARCLAGTPDLAEIRRRFDDVTPGLKGAGIPRGRALARLQADGGVMIEYDGRRYHSSYMVGPPRNWVTPEQPLFAEVAFDGGVDANTVYVEHRLAKSRVDAEGVFFPWSSKTKASACR
jgi:hypothetical protein